MAEDQYGIVIENVIANAATKTLNFTQIYHLVRDQLCSTASKTTINRWLTKLIEKEIIDKDDNPRIRNEVYYSLTPARIFERQLFGAESKSREEVEQLLTSDNNEREQEPLKKAWLLILLQSALGTEVSKVADEPLPGGVCSYNPTTGTNECLISDKLPGVTMKEVLEQKNIGLGGLFNQVNFTRLLRKNDCVKMIHKELDIDNNTVVVRRLVRTDNEEIGIEIVDKQLRDFITMCACMMTWIHSRLSDTVTVALLHGLCRKGKGNPHTDLHLPFLSFSSHFEQEAFKLYLSLYGRKELNYEFKRCKEIADKLTENVVVAIQGSKNTKKQPSKSAIKKKIHELIEKRKDEIMQSDKNIIAFYHGLIKCDRYVDAPGALGKGNRYDKYRNYVKIDMPKKYRYLTDILMKLAYPSFLQRYHSTNPELVEFTKSLPCAPD